MMLTAGDEFGRTQHGNNNAYAQDNDITWLDWEGRDCALEAYTFALAALRRSVPALGETGFLTGMPSGPEAIPDVAWLTEPGLPLTQFDWQDQGRHRLVMVLDAGNDTRLAVVINGDRRACLFTLPVRDGYRWVSALAPLQPNDLSRPVPGRTVMFMIECRAEGQGKRR